MARHYSTRAFFRQMPNSLLARYFHENGFFTELNFTAMKETKPDELFAAWLDLPEFKRRKMETEFHEIFELSCEKGFRSIIDEAEWHLTNDAGAFGRFVEQLSGLSNHFERAMITFLDYAQYWNGATHFYHADMLTYWRKRKNLPHQAAAMDESSLRELADLLRNYFHRAEGRGNNCVVEPFRRGDLDYFFAYPEDYSQHSIECVNGHFGRRPHHPAFEIVYVYSQREGSLDLNYRGPSKSVELLQGMFATAILKLSQLPPDPKDARVYDLNPLRRRGFSFVYDATSGIQSVAVKKLRLSSKVKQGDRITLEASVNNNSNAIYDLLEKISQVLPLQTYNVTQTELAASIIVDAQKPPRRVPIRLTHPNSCSLKYDERDLRLREMLSASGIELKQPTEATEADDQAQVAKI